LEIILEALKNSGHEDRVDGLDVAASEFYDAKNNYIISVKNWNQ
jgi:enolase